MCPPGQEVRELSFFCMDIFAEQVPIGALTSLSVPLTPTLGGSWPQLSLYLIFLCTDCLVVASIVLVPHVSFRLSANFYSCQIVDNYPPVGLPYKKATGVTDTESEEGFCPKGDMISWKMLQLSKDHP